MELGISEQEELLQDFKCPLDFIECYTRTYIKQLDVPTKVQLTDIPYYSKFECAFLEDVLNQALAQEADRMIFRRMEELLWGFRSHKYYDRRFYDETSLVLIKGISVFVDRIDQEIRKRNYSNIRHLYYYCSDKIDVGEILVGRLVENIKDVDFVIREMGEMEKAVEFINGEIRDAGTSCFSRDKRLRSRVVLSDQMLGVERVGEYKRDELYRYIMDAMKMEGACRDVNEGYLFIMEFYSGCITGGMGSEEMLRELKEYADSLIDERR
jgi:hypothetical protein